MQPGDGPALFPEGLPVAAGLGVDEIAERERRRPAFGSRGDRSVFGSGRRQLEENARAGVALMELAGGMEKAGAEVEDDRPSGP